MPTSTRRGGTPRHSLRGCGTACNADLRLCSVPLLTPSVRAARSRSWRCSGKSSPMRSSRSLGVLGPGSNAHGPNEFLHIPTGQKLTAVIARLLGDHARARVVTRHDTLWGMCRRVTCKVCNRPNWAGCGAHVEQVLGDVPPAQRCQCRTTKAVAAPSTEPKKSWFARLRS